MKYMVPDMEKPDSTEDDNPLRMQTQVIIESVGAVDPLISDIRPNVEVLDTRTGCRLHVKSVTFSDNVLNLAKRLCEALNWDVAQALYDLREETEALERAKDKSEKSGKPGVTLG